jgi:RNA methyltransferase, TrmH family
VREALGVAGCVHQVFATPKALGRHEDLASQLRAGSLSLSLCDDAALASLTASVSPQGIVAICGFLDCALADALVDDARLVAVAAHVRDPGNLGALIRCADAAGADAVVLAGSSVDPYNDKVVRASVGSLFHLPLVLGGTAMAATVDVLHARQFSVVAAVGSARETIDQMAATDAIGDRVAWVFGNEARGLEAADRALCDREIAVPIYGRAESLNVATAAAVCLYTTAWAQRRR